MNRASRVAGLFPWPFVGVALLLAVVIVITPLLTTSDQPAVGSIGSQADLIVDAVSGHLSTKFYVRGYGATTRYEEIRLGFAFGFGWTGGFPSGPLHWTDWQNVSSTLSVNATAYELPVAVNVSALYSANGVNALYVGMFAMDVGTPSGTSAETLTVVSDTSGISGFTYPVSLLPILIPLADVGSGGGT